MTYSEYHENPITVVVVITTSLREGQTWSPHCRESSTVLRCAHCYWLSILLTYSARLRAYLALCCIGIRRSLQAK
jgi:hypothetical protein